MTKYRRKPRPSTQNDAVLGLLYIVSVRLVRKVTREKVKHRLLVVGHEADDIGRKLAWLFDSTQFEEMSIQTIEKVREKIHFLSTRVEPEAVSIDPIIKRQHGTDVIPQRSPTSVDSTLSVQYAVGVATHVFAVDPEHAMRKVGRVLLSMGGEGDGKLALPDGSTITIEEIHSSSGFASARDVSQHETNRAHIVRG